MRLLGKPISEKIKSHLIDRAKPEGKLAVVHIGDDPISSLYVRKKAEFAQEVGAEMIVADSTSQSIQDDVKKLASQTGISGIIIQLPLPPEISREELLQLIPKEKDVDGFRYIVGDDYVSLPPTVLAINEVFNFYNISIEKGVLIVGGGFLVGKPLQRFLRERGVEVTVLEKGDSDYAKKLKQHKVVVVATGGGRFFAQNEFMEGAFVIDASTVQDDNKVRGDVSTEGGYINLAPVPGGVGPITVAMLFQNFFDL